MGPTVFVAFTVLLYYHTHIHAGLGGRCCSPTSLIPCPADLIRCIEDPEKSASLEDLGVVSEDDVSVSRFSGPDGAYYVRVQLTPTVPHCSLATLIGLCVRVRLQENLDFEHKLDIVIKEGSHQTSDEGKSAPEGTAVIVIREHMVFIRCNAVHCMTGMRRSKLC